MLTQTSETYGELLAKAKQLYQAAPDWATFYRQVLGKNGVVRKAFPDHEDPIQKSEEFERFKSSDEFQAMLKLVAKLREKRGNPEKESEPTRVITVRLPKSVHEVLLEEAGEKKLSMNKLCISKLMHIIDEQFIPKTPPPLRPRRRKKVALQTPQTPRFSDNGADVEAARSAADGETAGDSEQ